MNKCARCGHEYDQFSSYGIKGECTDCFLDAKNPHGLDLSEEIAEARADKALIDQHEPYSQEWLKERQKQGLEG
tara:strand:- start:14 stop:235 length:222 start_codon:yes stop_codon:yes gene_type:complete